MAGTAWADYRRLLAYVRPYWKPFLLASLVMAVYGSTDAMFAALMKPMLDEGFVARDPDMIRLVPLLLILLFVFRGLTGFASNYGMNWVGRRVIETLRGELFRKLVRLPVAFYDRSTTGDLVARLIYHVEQVAQASTNAVTILIRDSFTVLFLLAWMFLINGWLAGLFVIIGPVMAVLIRSVSRRLREVNRRIQDSMGDVTHLAEEAVTGQRVIKAFGGEAVEVAAFDAVNKKNRSLQMKMIATSTLSVQLVQLLGAITFALVIWLATRHPAADAISAGDFVSFITAMMLLMPPLKRLTSVNASLQRGIAAASSLFGLLDTAPEADTGTHECRRAQGRLAFEDVRFRYDTGQPPVLDGVSFTIEPGQTVAVVGRSGSGKSTLANLIPRFYEPESGRIRLDGVGLHDYRLADLRRQIALVGQEVVLFNDTVARNIAYGQSEGAPREAIERAAELASAMDFIRELPQGLDTPVGEHGAMLSGGQRQRIAIARALLKDAPLLILDEATSALDTESERAIQAALERLMQGRTTLVIAHRLSTVERADCILVLDQGRVVEAGRHEELLAREGHYAGLYRLQFSDRTLM
ncbi:lipid A export permease/ATP-binding protein MsbA [Thiohalobacter thiocyanaticus]|uniref:Lipid A export permease/ATP-binding protein MsbA n=1 Tax=Thiohalobacter thiocyanaticus TaxID=585455 RepID=A0A426QFT1_9GAMM|nr:lipid A export permease/ATP-binding protein MsbA [Thiohalobacter thiocyanaticus]RRQ20610.1 lipid A export permease/ATP-binding protein MsbA [Thiohalobacter thiocyanaticus]